MNAKNLSEKPRKETCIGWVLRDMMQSTGVWTFDPGQMQKLVVLATEVGFSSLEIGGGQSFQIALQHGLNPYRLIRAAKRSIDGEAACMPLQVLLRGANQFGFRHYPASVQTKNIDVLRDAGGDPDKAKTIIIRNFDALNDAENLRFSIAYMVEQDVQARRRNDELIAQGVPATENRLHVQAALSYVRPTSDAVDACYGTRYYVNYASRLMAIARDAGGELDSLCIKDMSSQLAPANARELFTALQALGLPIFLHCHSTDEAQAMAVQAIAVQCGIDGVEVAIDPLAGGASHNDVAKLAGLNGVQPLQQSAVAKLKSYLQEIFPNHFTQRKDYGVPLGSLKQLIAAGIPGGAIPFVINDLQANVCAMLGIELDVAIELFKVELQQTQRALGIMPLVTPTADIISKQVIKSLGNRQRSENYQLMDARFCSLVLGHYGWLVNYANGERINVAEELVSKVLAYCADIEPNADEQRVHAGRVYPEPVVLAGHPALREVTEESAEAEPAEIVDAQLYLDDLFSRYPRSCSNFGSKDECFLMYAMRPVGKTDRLLTQNILKPTEQRLRLILDNTLHLLPRKHVPEARDPTDDEATDVLLLDALGDYDGIIASIRDLVLTGDLTGGSADIKNRVGKLMNDIVDPLCKSNTQMQTHRYYIERRFVALYAAAVFWDLQRVCRRTGADSRSDTDEMTAAKLDRIVATTLRKRQREGLGKAPNFLG